MFNTLYSNQNAREQAVARDNNGGVAPGAFGRLMNNDAITHITQAAQQRRPVGAVTSALVEEITGNGVIGDSQLQPARNG